LFFSDQVIPIFKDLRYNMACWKPGAMDVFGVAIHGIGDRLTGEHDEVE